MKKQWLLALLTLPIFYTHAKDPCTEKGWQNARITKMESGESYFADLKIAYYKDTKIAISSAVCWAKGCDAVGGKYAGKDNINLPVKVKLSRNADCGTGVECVSEGYPNACVVDDLKLASTGRVARSIFTQAGLEDKPILRTCYRDPCSVARVMSYQVLENHTTNQLLKLNIVGGSQYAEYKNGKYHYTSPIKWNHKAHNVYIRCSLTKPTVQIGKQKTVLPLNPQRMVAGVLVSSAELYLNACHNYSGEMTAGAKRFGYNVAE